MDERNGLERRTAGPALRRVEPGGVPVIVGSLWMVGLTIALFFLPLVNGLIGGLVGGYLVGRVGRALLAALLPAVVVAIGLFFGFSLADLPGLGAIAGIGAGALVVLIDLGILFGAFLGGWAAEQRRDRRIEA